jgi:glycosyltransferase involved in cell wall biosynthesis
MIDHADSAARSRRSGAPLRVLQLVSMLHNGGVERWVVDLCEAGRAENLAMDIAVLWDQKGLFSDRARKRGISVSLCAGRGNPLKFVWALRRFLRERGPYDAIHCHVHAFSAFAVLAACLAGVPVRVVHSHNVVQNSTKSLGRRAYIAIARALIRVFATAGRAPSAWAAEDLWGPKWRTDPRWRVEPCGFDLAPFRAPIAPDSSRAAFGIPPQALVLGSVGRLNPEKNSEFLVDVLASVRRRSDAYLLLIGEGPLRKQVEQRAREGGHGDHLVLAGVRSDVPVLLRDVMDVFVFPSPPPPRGNEALAIAVIEAQAAGLRSVISDGVPPEAVLVPDLVVRVPADAGPDKWAEAVLDQARRPGCEVARQALAILEHSTYNIAISIKTLAALYSGM